MTIEMLALTILVSTIAFIAGYFLSRTKAVKTEIELKSQLARQQEKSTELQTQQDQTNQALEVAQTTLNEQGTQFALNQQQLANLTEESKQHQRRANTSEQKNEQLQANLTKIQSELATTIAKLQSANSNEQALNETLTQKIDKIEQLQVERNGLSEALATLKTSLSEKETHFTKLLTQLNEQKEILKKEFQNLANEILEAKGKAFSEQNKASLDAMLNPFKEQLEGFRKRVDEVHTHQTAGQASLKTELIKLHELNQRITDEAANLTKALKGDKKKQGSWGELQVEMILDQSGLRKGLEYEREPNRKDEDAKNWRPDFIVNLPESKHVIIDSKVSLNDYNDYVAADSDLEREASLIRHVQAVRKHINDLYKRDYSQLQGVNSPDFVFMFMPIEPAFNVAFEKDQSLFNTAFEKHIVVVTPTTMLATLRTISNLWSIERQNQSARVLADQGAKVYDKLRIFVEKMEKLGGQLSIAQKTYDDAHGTLTGSRSLTSTVQKFVDLGVRVKKELPATVVESALLDDDTITSLEHQADAETETIKKETS
ncbi:MAG: DNA recombination protein RmuC [Gammaproteobacteria bacterium]|nr:DNA recombination protein RmuC [Gammaproteobacteria bacterium]